jgi:hypothetical protein
LIEEYSYHDIHIFPGFLSEETSKTVMHIGGSHQWPCYNEKTETRVRAADAGGICREQNQTGKIWTKKKLQKSARSGRKNNGSCELKGVSEAT